MNDITALVKGNNKEGAGMANKVMKKLKEEVEQKASNCQLLNMERKERVR